MPERRTCSSHYIPWAEFLEVVAMVKRADKAAGVERWWEDETTLRLAREAAKESRESYYQTDDEG